MTQDQKKQFTDYGGTIGKVEVGDYLFDNCIFLHPSMFLGAHFKPEHIDLESMVFRLSRILRFQGASKVSVLYHSMMVAEQMQGRYRIYGLLHDMHEAFIGDIPKPLGQAVERMTSSKKVFPTIKENIDNAIYEKVGLPRPTALIRKQIVEADKICFQDEIQNQADFNPINPNEMRASFWKDYKKYMTAYEAFQPKKSEVKVEGE